MSYQPQSNPLQDLYVANQTGIVNIVERSAMEKVDEDTWVDDFLETFEKAIKKYSNPLFEVTLEKKEGTGDTRVRMIVKDQYLSLYTIHKGSENVKFIYDDRTVKIGSPRMSKQNWLETKADKKLAKAWDIVALMYEYSLANHVSKTRITGYDAMDWTSVDDIIQRLVNTPVLDFTISSGTYEVCETGNVHVKTKVFHYRSPEKGITNIEYLIMLKPNHYVLKTVLVRFETDGKSAMVDVYKNASPLAALGAAMLSLGNIS